MSIATAARPAGAGSEERAELIDARFQVPIFIAALLVIPVIVIEQVRVGHAVKVFGGVLNWLIWVAFAAEVIVMLAVVPNRMRWARAHPLEVAIVVLTPPLLPASLQALRLFRLLRVLRLTILVKQYRRLFTLEGVHGAAVLAAIAAFGGGAIFSEVEKGYSVWDGVWFAVTTMTTVGYGDLSPHTTSGRLLAIALMVICIGFVALLTGAIAQRFPSPQISRSLEEAEADVATDVGDIRAELVRGLRGITARLQELEEMVQRTGVPSEDEPEGA
jgi:voltage-gated potassium channel